MAEEDAFDDLMTPAQLRHLREQREQARVRELMAKHRQEAELAQEQQLAFLERKVDAAAIAWVRKRAQQAAANGASELRVLSFPAAWCSDHGRAINNLEPDWPGSLTGYAKDVYETFLEHFEHLGYRMRAQVLTYTGEGLGEVALFLCW